MYVALAQQWQQHWHRVTDTCYSFVPINPRSTRPPGMSF